MLDRILNRPVCVIALAMVLGCGLAFVSLYVFAFSFEMQLGWGRQIANWIVDTNLAGSHSDQLAFYARSAMLHLSDWLFAALCGAILGSAFRKRWLLAGFAGGIGFVVIPQMMAWTYTWNFFPDSGIGVMVQVWLWELPSLLLMLLAAFIAASIGGEKGRELSSPS